MELHTHLLTLGLCRLVESNSLYIGCFQLYWWSFGTKLLSLTVSEIFNVECNAMVDMTLIRPLNKGKGHSFW